MSDMVIGYMGFMAEMIIGWLKFLPKVANVKNLYKILNSISFLVF